jgi:hypothetical protein
LALLQTEYEPSRSAKRHAARAAPAGCRFRPRSQSSCAACSVTVVPMRRNAPRSLPSSSTLRVPASPISPKFFSPAGWAVSSMAPSSSHGSESRSSADSRLRAFRPPPRDLYLSTARPGAWRYCECSCDKSRHVTLASSTLMALAGLGALALFGDWITDYYLLAAVLILFCLPTYAIEDVQDGIARGYVGWMSRSFRPKFCGPCSCRTSMCSSFPAA